MSKKCFFAILCMLFLARGYSQTAPSTIFIYLPCSGGTVAVSKAATSINGRDYYEGIGTYNSFTNVPITVHWAPSPVNAWLLSLDGQPFFSNSCDSLIPPYSTNTQCTWQSIDGATCTGSGTYWLSSNFALPLHVIRFYGINVEKGHFLEWTTASNRDVASFQIQRSNDARNWETIASLPYQVSTDHYTYLVTNPPIGQHFYRIVQVDKNGNIFYTPVLRLDVTTNRPYTLSGDFHQGIYVFHHTFDQTLSFSVTDMNGKRITSGNIFSQDQRIDLSKQAAGMYILTVLGNTTIVEKLIKY